MQEYLENGTRLGWLCDCAERSAKGDRKSRRVEIYRQGQAVEILESPTSLSGENVLPGFILNLELIW